MCTTHKLNYAGLKYSNRESEIFQCLIITLYNMKNGHGFMRDCHGNYNSANTVRKRLSAKSERIFTLQN